MKLFLLLLALIVLACSQSICPNTGFFPEEAEFDFQLCTQFQDNSCCRTAMEVDVDNAWSNVVDDLGNCNYRYSGVRPDLSSFFCVPCDSALATYIAPYPDFYNMSGQNYLSNDSNPSTVVVTIVPTLFYKLSFMSSMLAVSSDDSGNNVTAFDECGLRDQNGNVVFPISFFDGISYDYLAFISTFLPPWIVGSDGTQWAAAVVDDSASLLGTTQTLDLTGQTVFLSYYGSSVSWDSSTSFYQVLNSTTGNYDVFNNADLSVTYPPSAYGSSAAFIQISIGLIFAALALFLI